MWTELAVDLIRQFDAQSLWNRCLHCAMAARGDNTGVTKQCPE
jgi:hypothetical protein